MKRISLMKKTIAAFVLKLLRVEKYIRTLLSSKVSRAAGRLRNIRGPMPRGQRCIRPDLVQRGRECISRNL